MAGGIYYSTRDIGNCLVIATCHGRTTNRRGRFVCYTLVTANFLGRTALVVVVIAAAAAAKRLLHCNCLAAVANTLAGRSTASGFHRMDTTTAAGGGGGGIQGGTARPSGTTGGIGLGQCLRRVTTTTTWLGTLSLTITLTGDDGGFCTLAVALALGTARLGGGGGGELFLLLLLLLDGWYFHGCYLVVVTMAGSTMTKSR